MRIDKLLSQLKYGSRSDIKKIMAKGDVFINDVMVKDSATNVDPCVDHILINGETLFYKDPIYLALNKPIGYLSANHDAMHPCITELIKPPYHRFDFAIAGRLDLDAEGLMIITTDGSFAHQITHPKYHLPKTYEVILDKPLTHQKTLLKGVTINDGKNEPFIAKALEVSVEKNCVKLTIDEGKFHQVKRMFKAVGYEVINLKRIQIGKLKLNDIPKGSYIEVRREDIS